MSDPAGYTVGWICALLVEYIAAQEFLDEEHEKPSFVSPNDDNDYTLGKMGEHNVVIAVLPDGEYGTASAANVATNMLNSFHNIRIGFMVGVGGGVPSKSHDIRLGDIVVSAPRDGAGGVFQYDFGKSIQDQSFRHTLFLNQPPTTLRTAITGIQAQYKRKGHQLQEATNSVLDKNPRLRQEYKQPSINTDRLFKAEVIHKLDCRDTLCVDELSKLVLRDERADYEDNPAIHYGLIASGNQLMKDALIRDRLAAEKDVLCFEMEASGLMNTFPCLVIRGICDYSDSHKNKGWQGYAAMVAAAYARDLLRRIPLNKIEAEERISVLTCDVLKSTNQLLDRANDQREQHYHELKTRALTDQQQHYHQVFKIANYTEQKDINPGRVEGTCQWALGSPEYVRWLNSNSDDLLWVSADPGCGKSVLARSIIDEYLEALSPAATICYFFFKDNDEQKHVAAALCSVLHQLFSQRPDLLHYAIPSFEKNGEKNICQEFEELWQIFIMATSTNISRKTICIFDALDECCDIDRNRLLSKLQSFYHKPRSPTPGTYLKFLVTSRPYDHIEDQFRAITNSFPYLHLKGEEENYQIHKEIDLVVRIRVRELAETIPLSLDIHRRVEEQLLQMAHRTYLWLHLAIDDIRTTFKRSLRPEASSIKLIPPSVSAAYEKILCRVPDDQKDTVRQILQIIVVARRPLTIQEMAMALGIATSPESKTTIQARLDPMNLDRKLRQLCGLFVFTNNSKVYLIHQTARDFLIRKEMATQSTSIWSGRLEDMDCQMATICLRYLSMENSEQREDSAHSSIGSFLDYSAIYWPDHIRAMTSTPEQEVEDLLFQLYDISADLFSLWFPIFWRAVEPAREAPMMTSLHLAAFNGHTQILHRLLGTGESNVDSPDSTGSTAVMWASLNGHDGAVKLILSHGANVNIGYKGSSNALYNACSGGHYKIVQMLLEHGADVNAIGGKYGNALQAASAAGYDQIVQTLIEYGADVNYYGGDCCNPLFAAYLHGHFSTMQTLLRHGADVNVSGQYYGNTLQAICGASDVTTMRMLLEHRASLVCHEDERYANVLCVACFEGRTEIAQILLEYGAEINAPVDPYINSFLYDWYDAEVSIQVDSFGNSLLAACSRGHTEIVRMLLQHRADITAQDREKFHGNALEVACHEGHDKIVELLLDKGADANAQGGLYGNALQSACVEGHGHVVQIMLEHEANVNAQGGHYGNALQAACSKGYSNIVQILLERGADVNAQGGFYGNALQAARSEGNRIMVQMLLERGADQSTPDILFSEGL